MGPTQSTTTTRRGQDDARHAADYENWRGHENQRMQNNLQQRQAIIQGNLGMEREARQRANDFNLATLKGFTARTNINLKSQTAHSRHKQAQMRHVNDQRRLNTQDAIVGSLLGNRSFSSDSSRYNTAMDNIDFMTYKDGPETRFTDTAYIDRNRMTLPKVYESEDYKGGDHLRGGKRPS